jgi:hypothetical protein
MVPSHLLFFSKGLAVFWRALKMIVLESQFLKEGNE